MISNDFVSHAYPVFPSSEDIPIFGEGSDLSTALFSDSSDPHSYYIPPKRVVIANDPLSGRKLFKLSYSPSKKEAELNAVLKLGFNQEEVRAAWSAKLSEDPRAQLLHVPIANGILGLEFETSNFKVQIGEADPVRMDLNGGFIPLRIKIPERSWKFLISHNNQVGRKLLTLQYHYLITYAFPGKKIVFSTNPRDLMNAVIEHPKMRSHWPHVDAVSYREVDKILILLFAQGKWQYSSSSDSQFNILYVSRLFRNLLESYIGKIIKSEFKLNRKKFIINLDTSKLPDQWIDLSSVGQKSIHAVKDAAALSLLNICKNYSGSIYNSDTGESLCESLGNIINPEIPQTTPTDPWIPQF